MSYSIPTSSSPTEEKFTIRPVKPEDSAAIQELLLHVEESGPVETRMQFKVQNVPQGWDVISPGNFCLGAYAGDEQKLVGYISAWPHLAVFGPVYHHEQVIRVNGYMLHPAYRRGNLSLKLVQELLSWTGKTFGLNDMLVYACIQKVDEDLKELLAQIGGTVTNRQLELIPLKTLPADANKKYSALPVNIREAQADDFARISNELNTFYKDFDFYIPQSALFLASWLSPKVLDGRPPQKLATYYVAEDQAGTLVAGAGVFNTPSVYDVKVTKVTRPIQALNSILKLLPADGWLGPLLVSRVWYKQGQLKAARYLWQEVRQREHHHGKTLIISYDSKSALKSMFNPPAWYPKSKMQLIIFNQPAGFDSNQTNRYLATYES